MISTAELDLTSSVNVSFLKENDNFLDEWWVIAAIEEQEKTIHIHSISGKRYSMLRTMNEEGFLFDQAKHIPLPKHLDITSRET